MSAHPAMTAALAKTDSTAESIPGHDCSIKMEACPTACPLAPASP